MSEQEHIGADSLVPWANPHVMLGTAAQQYVQEHSIPAACDVKRVAYMVNDFFKYFGPEYDIAKIGRKESRDYANHRMQVGGVCAATTRRELAILRAVLGHANREGRLAVPPKFWMPPGSPARMRWMTKDEHRTLMASPMPWRVRMFFVVAFNTGARSRAIEQLTWDRVDLGRRTIDFRLPGVNHKGKRRVVAPINDALLPRLEAAHARPDRGELVIGPGCSTYRECKDALKAIGIDERGCARHVVRHTFVSWRLQAGVSIYEVAKLVGDTVTQIEKTYGHMTTEHLMGAANRI